MIADIKPCCLGYAYDILRGLSRVHLAMMQSMIVAVAVSFAVATWPLLGSQTLRIHDCFSGPANADLASSRVVALDLGSLQSCAFGGGRVRRTWRRGTEMKACYFAGLGRAGPGWAGLCLAGLAGLGFWAGLG